MKPAFSTEIKSSALLIPQRPHSRQGTSLLSTAPALLRLRFYIFVSGCSITPFAAQSVLDSAAGPTASLRKPLQFFDPG